MYRADQPSVVECWRKLEEFDDLMAVAHDWRHRCQLEQNRKWWAQALRVAQAREGYPRRNYDTSSGTTTTTQSS
jgi:hypothetical protein